MDWEKIIEETKTPEEMKGFAKKLIEKLSKGQKEELLDILLEDKNNTEKLEEESNPFLGKSKIKADLRQKLDPEGRKKMEKNLSKIIGRPI